LCAVNFDIAILRPGCGGVPSFTYVSKFYVTLLLMLMAAILFLLACLVRFCVRAYRDELPEATVAENSAPSCKQSTETEGLQRNAQDDSTYPSHPLSLPDPNSSDQQPPGVQTASAAMTTTDQATAAQLTASTKRTSHRRRASLAERVAHARSSRSPHWIDFTERLRHAMLILLCIFFLRICILEFKTFRCESLPVPPTEISSNAQQTDASYLSEDGITRCLSAEHIGLIVAAVILLIGFTLGYPLFVFVLLTRTFADDSTQGIVGWLRRRVKLLRVDNGRVASCSPKLQEVGKADSIANGDAERKRLEELQRERERTYGFLFMVRSSKHIRSMHPARFCRSSLICCILVRLLLCLCVYIGLSSKAFHDVFASILHARMVCRCVGVPRQSFAIAAIVPFRISIRFTSAICRSQASLSELDGQCAKARTVDFAAGPRGRHAWIAGQSKPGRLLHRHAVPLHGSDDHAQLQKIGQAAVWEARIERQYEGRWRRVWRCRS
jgi:hypothetical protein